MKYLKTYEKVFNDQSQIYYRIDIVSLPHFQAALRKIGVDPKSKTYDDFSHDFNNYTYEGSNIKCIYIGGGVNADGQDWWFLSSNLNQFKQNNFKFRGRVNVEDHEINADKYNI